MKRSLVIDVICYLLVFLFVYAAVSKLMDLEKFRVQIGQSPLLTPFTDLVIFFIPGIEILISIALAIPRLRLIGLYASFSIMVMFTVYIVTILNISSYVPCSCGGVLEKLGWTEHLIFNLFFALLALCGVIFQSKEQYCLHSKLGKEPTL